MTVVSVWQSNPSLPKRLLNTISSVLESRPLKTSSSTNNSCLAYRARAMACHSVSFYSSPDSETRSMTDQTMFLTTTHGNPLRTRHGTVSIRPASDILLQSTRLNDCVVPGRIECGVTGDDVPHTVVRYPRGLAAIRDAGEVGGNGTLEGRQFA